MLVRVQVKESFYLLMVSIAHWWGSLQKSKWIILQKLKRNLSYNPVMSFLAICPKNMTSTLKKPAQHCFSLLFTISRGFKQGKCLETDEWIRQVWYKCTMEFYSASKKTEFMKFACKRMGIENSLLMDTTYTQNDKHRFFYLWLLSQNLQM